MDLWYNVREGQRKMYIYIDAELARADMYMCI